jgi:hypothetical protein
MMPSSFLLSWPDAESLLGSAKQGGWLDIERRSCPINPDHRPGRRRWNELIVKFPHNRREDSILWTLGDCLVHERLLADFERLGFKGWRSLPAKVCFRDGEVSDQYRELLVTGWAGMADAQSGVSLVDVCRGCGQQFYLRGGKPTRIVNWDCWSGDHVFRVWPWPRCILVTEDVARFLQSCGAQSLDLDPPEHISALGRAGKTYVWSLSDVFPEDLASQYNALLHLE